jgi:hypothetical protein
MALAFIAVAVIWMLLMLLLGNVLGERDRGTSIYDVEREED